MIIHNRCCYLPILKLILLSYFIKITKITITHIPFQKFFLKPLYSVIACVRACVCASVCCMVCVCARARIVFGYMYLNVHVSFRNCLMYKPFNLIFKTLHYLFLGFKERINRDIAIQIFCNVYADI